MYVKLTAKAPKQGLKDLNKALLESLDNLKWPLSTKRDHVFKQSEADERIQFGVTNSYSDGIVLSTATGKEKYNQLMNLLIEISKLTQPPISYSTIQVTKNAEASPHYDAKNSGKSYLYCLGSYTGGGLWIQSPQGKDVQKLTKAIRGKTQLLKPGTELPGDYYDAHEKMISFDPQQIHTTEPFKGTRYAITYYTLARWKELDLNAQKVLTDFGFQLPSIPKMLTTSKLTKSMEHTPLGTERKDDNCARRVYFESDSSSDSHEESEEEQPLLHTPIIDSDDVINDDRKFPGETEIGKEDSDDSAEADSGLEQPMTQAEKEELTGQLDFDYSVCAVRCSPQLHQKLKSAIENTWTILNTEYETFGINRMKIVEPHDKEISPVDPHQVWWTAFGPQHYATLPMRAGRYECPYCDKVYTQKWYSALS